LTRSLPVLSSTKLKNNTDEAQAASAADAPSSRATGAAAAPVNFRQNPAWTAPLTADAIHDHLSDYWDWDGVETPNAWTLYGDWSRKNVSEDMLFQAVQQLEANWPRDKGPCTPFALAPVLADLFQQNRLAA
jgi:hypothetical protein